MKGIVLAGGRGARFDPVTRAVSKHLLPVVDRPLIYFPLSLLMSAGIREIAVVVAPEHEAAYRRLLGDGSQWGVVIAMCVQPEPGGIAQGFLVAERFLDGGAAALVLGDNVFVGRAWREVARRGTALGRGALAVACRVAHPGRYGVVSFDAGGRPRALVEKPAVPDSPWALTGLYFCDARAPELARALTPSSRGELEIVDLLERYRAGGRLDVVQLGDGPLWLDAGTPEALLEASSVVRGLEHRTGSLLASPELAALERGWIDRAGVIASVGDARVSSYARSVLAQIEDDVPPARPAPGGRGSAARGGR